MYKLATLLFFPPGVPLWPPRQAFVIRCKQVFANSRKGKEVEVPLPSGKTCINRGPRTYQLLSGQMCVEENWKYGRIMFQIPNRMYINTVFDEIVKKMDDVMVELYGTAVPQKFVHKN